MQSFSNGTLGKGNMPSSRRRALPDFLPTILAAKYFKSAFQQGFGLQLLVYLIVDELALRGGLEERRDGTGQRV